MTTRPRTVRPFIPLRSRCALWLVVPALVAAGLYAARYGGAESASGYWLGSTSASSIDLLFSCAVAAVGGAWEGRRYRLASLDRVPLGRRRARVVLGLLWAPVCCGWLVQLAAVTVATSGTWGAPATASTTVVLLLAVFAAVIVLHAAVGFVFGVVLPPIAGIPVALLFSYCWLGFTWSVSYFPIRYLSGLVLDTCCSVETTIDPRALWVPSLFSVIAGIAVVGIAAGRHRAIAGGVVVIAVAGGLVGAGGLGATPARPRPADELVCSGRRPVVCLYPEQRRTTDAEDVVRAAWTNLARTGLDLPPRVDASVGRSDEDRIAMLVGLQETPVELVHSLTTSFFAPTIVADCGSVDEYDRRLAIADVLSRWLIDRAAPAGVPTNAVPSLTGSPEPPATAAALDALPLRSQIRWVEETLPRLTDCAAPPTGPPGP